MSDNKSISGINFGLGELAKPANTLIEKVSSAVGGLFEPWQVKRVAKAQSEADLIRANSDIQITDLQRRAVHRLIEEEASRQENMEQITQKAIPLLNENSEPDQMDDDWIVNYFDKSRIVSDEEMQNLWAAVLAGEANSPGTFSRKTINIMGDLDKVDAEKFQALCRFCWHIHDDRMPLIYEFQDKIYKQHGISVVDMFQLENLGLARVSEIGEMSMASLPNSVVAQYCNVSCVINMQSDDNNDLPIGHVLLTQAGQELAAICAVEQVDGFFEYIVKYLDEYLVGIIKTD